LPRAETYHEEQQRYRHKVKPYHSARHYGEEDDSDSDHRADEYPDSDDDLHGFNSDDRRELEDNLEDETQAPDGNMWNPKGRRNNCAAMAMAQVFSKPVDEVEDDIGGLSEDVDGLSHGHIARQVERYGGRVVYPSSPSGSGSPSPRLPESPPPEEYFEDGGQAAVLYANDGQVGHAVNYGSGHNERNMTFDDYQSMGTVWMLPIMSVLQTGDTIWIVIRGTTMMMRTTTMIKEMIVCSDRLDVRFLSTRLGLGICIESSEHGFPARIICLTEGAHSCPSWEGLIHRCWLL
jgi:hypothetical protein